MQKTAYIYIVDDNWRQTESGAEIRLFGRAQDGSPAQITITDYHPIQFTDTPPVDAILPPSILKSLDGNPVWERRDPDLSAEPIAPSPETPSTIYTSDLNPLESWIYETGKGIFVQVDGDCVEGKFNNPVITPATPWTPKLVFASLDIETSCFGNDLYCIGVHALTPTGEVSKVFMIGKDTNTDLIEYYPSEGALMNAFIPWFNALDPDVILGWHIHEFDIKFLEQKAQRWNIPFTIGRFGAESGHDAITRRTHLPGRVILDGVECLNLFEIPLNGNSLEAVAQQLLGEGKLIQPSDDKVKEIERMFARNKSQLAMYNLKDAELVNRIFEKTNLLDSLIKLTQSLKCPLSRVTHVPSAMDRYLLPILYAKGLTPPPRYAGPKMTIYEPHIRRHENPGYYKNVGKLTLPGLPTQVIALYGIDFLSIRHNHIMPLRLPTNTVVSQTQLTLTQLAREINAGLVTKNPVAKVISHYIELTTLTTKTRYFHPETRIAVITACQMIVRRATRSMAQFGLQPILRTGFTIYASSPAAPFQSDSIAIALTNAISEQSPLSDDTKNHRTPIVIQCDAQFPHFYLANPSETIAVRYVGSIGDNILCHGIIDGKISHSPLAQYFANALFQNLFKGAPLRAWITGTINDLRQGKYNDLLIFSKRIRKSPKRYRRNIPAHIKAAQLINRYTGKIQYVICTSGPIPIELNPINIDYDFYIKTEIAPILEALDESRQIDLGSLPSPNQLELF